MLFLQNIDISPILSAFVLHTVYYPIFYPTLNAYENEKIEKERRNMNYIENNGLYYRNHHGGHNHGGHNHNGGHHHHGGHNHYDHHHHHGGGGELPFRHDLPTALKHFKSWSEARNHGSAKS